MPTPTAAASTARSADPADPASNAHALGADLDWLAQLIALRFRQYFETTTTAQGSTPAAPAPPAPPALPSLQSPPTPPLPAPPDLSTSPAPYACFLRQHSASRAERVALLLALAPHLRPALLDVFFTRNATFDKPFTEFGGQHGAAQGQFSPTGDTLAFVLALLLSGPDVVQWLVVCALFDRAHWFARSDVLHLLPNPLDSAAAPLLRGVLQLSPDALARITTGQGQRPHLSSHFPASRLHSGLGWGDLVLHPATLAQVQEITTWLQHGHTLLQGWGMAARLRPGCRVLFHGPAGSGKTLTATLLGQTSGRPVYRVDLSLVVSKYIGETEKNLSRLFDAAQHQGWILFFDEADALFGKRSEARDAHDRYANQEVAYLLQRIESFDGITILASNLKDHLDPAFARRFEAVIYFPLPGVDERLKLWQQALPAAVRLAPDVDLVQIAAQHQLSGSAIVNAVRHACLVALADGSHCIGLQTLQQGIRRELAKDGRVG